jgi:hypothetical protein
MLLVKEESKSPKIIKILKKMMRKEIIQTLILVEINSIFYKIIKNLM